MRLGDYIALGCVITLLVVVARVRWTERRQERRRKRDPWMRP